VRPCPFWLGGTLIVLSGGTAVSASVAGTELLSGGTDRLAEVTSGGVQTVSAGGIALGDTIDSGGKQTISSGGVVSGTLVSGYEVVLGGGIASGSIAEAYAGNLYSVVVSGGESVGAIVLSNGAMSVSGVASYTWSGEVLSITVLAPSSALATTVNAGGELDVYAGGIISGTVLLGGAKEYVEQGGMALGTTVDNGAVEHLYDSGTAVGSVIEAGGIQSVTEATAFNDVVMSGGVVSDAGTVAYTEATGITSSFVGTLTGSGALVQSGPGTLVLAGNLSGFSGTAQISGGTLDLTSAGAGGSATIDFAPATTGILRIDGTTGTANTISGFTSGDIIDLAGLGFSGAEAPTVSGDTVTVTESGLMVSLMVAGASFRTFKLSSDGSAGTDVQIACYCPGTLILTDQGEIAVEALEIGDRLVTMTGAAEPIRWIGRRSYAGRFLAGKQHLLPVVIRAGALGGRLPRRDLRVSPNHAMFINRLLVPARQLVNGVSIVQELDCRRVDYIHVELADHRVIWAEGAPSETYLDDDNRAMFHNASEFTPLDGPGVSPPRYYATRVEEGFELEAIRTRLMLLADGRAAA
jgi:autotransporter passenger strand-loop-strand repeat protein/autotransporter-associated beta strand protein